MTDTINISASTSQHTRAIEIADALMADEAVSQAVFNYSVAKETAKVSAITLLGLIENDLTDETLDGLPIVGSQVTTGNQMADLYNKPVKGSFFDDLADEFMSSAVQVLDALDKLNPKRDGKVDLKQYNNLPEGFELPEWGSKEYDRAKAKYSQRRNNTRTLFKKAFRVRQLLQRCREVLDQGKIKIMIEPGTGDNRYTSSTMPITIMGDGKFDTWSVENFLQLGATIYNEAGEPTDRTKLDWVVEQGGDFNAVMAALKRSKTDEEGNDFQIKKVADFEEVTYLLNEFVQNSEGKYNSAAEASIVKELLKKDNREYLESFDTVFQFWSSIHAKVENHIAKLHIGEAQEQAKAS